jgi:hypothetical protein
MLNTKDFNTTDKLITWQCLKLKKDNQNINFETRKHF